MLGGGGTWTGQTASFETRITVLEGKYVRSTRFESIGAGTSGTLTLPANSTIVLDDFGGATDAVVTTISGGRPTFISATDAGAAVVATTLNAGGDWVFSSTPSSYPVAVVYRIQQLLPNFDSTDASLVGDYDVRTAGSGSGDLLAANNLSDVASATASRTNLGVGIGNSPEFTALNIGHPTDTTLTRVSAGVVAVEGSNVLLASGLGSVTQAYDTELAALAAVTSAADKLPYFTGLGTAAVTDFSSFGRSLVDDANAGTARTTLGLGNSATATIGIDVQAYDVELAALASVTSAADKLPYFTGLGTAAVTDFTTFGRSLVDDADAGTARTTLGLGTMSTQNATAVSITGGSVTGITDLIVADGGTGVSNFTAYTVICGGTSGTGALQNVTATGTAGQVLTSNGAGALPNWQDASGGVTDPELLALAALVSAADKLPYFTGSGTAALTDLSAFGRTLIDDADASSARTTLGLGNAATATIGVSVQAYDAELAAIAALSATADQMAYFTGAGTAALTTITTFGRSLIDDADAGSARTTLGVAIGVNVQAYDAELAAIAALSATANQLAYFTGAGTAALTTLSSFGRTLIDDADAGSARTTLGLGNAATATIGVDVQAYDADLTTLGAGGTAARTFLGLAIGTNVQAYDAELAAIAALSATADQMAYFTGAGTAALTTLSSFARTLIDDADAGTMRTTLGLGNAATATIGTHVQAYDAELAAIAALSATANQLAYFTGAGTAALTTLTTFGRSLIDDADSGSARTTLGLVIGTNVQAYDADLASWAGVTRAAGFDTFTGTPSSANLRSLVSDETGSGSLVFATSPAIATPTLTDPIITGAILEDVYTITDAAAFEIDPSNGSIQLITLTANRTPAATNFAAGESITLMVADGTAYTITWSTIGVVWAGGSAPTLATSGYTVIEMWKVSSTVYGLHSGDVA